MRHFIEHVFHDLTHFDSKIFASLWPLLARPGFLTTEFLAGRRSRYVKPTTMFILVNLFFFFAKGGIMNWTLTSYVDSVPGARALVEQRASARGWSAGEYEERFLAAAREKQRTSFFFAIPFLALLLLALFPRRYFVEHLVYSIHFHAFYLLFLTVGLFVFFRGLLQPLVWVGLPQQVGNYLGREPGLNYFVLAAAAVYHFAALQRVYAAGPWKGLALGALLSAAGLAFLVYVFKPMVFYWVYYTV